MTTTSRRRGGFTLLEIIVVLAILAMGLGIISEMLRSSARYSERVEEETAVMLACETLMSSILAGDMTATIGIELPIPDAPNWTTKVELVDGPLENLVAVRITAQRYTITKTLDPSNPNMVLQTKVPTQGRSYVLKEWTRRADVHTRVVSTAADGSMTAIDGTGLTVANDMNQNSAQGGSLTNPAGWEPTQFGSDSGSLFDTVDASFEALRGGASAASGIMMGNGQGLSGGL